MSQPAEATQTVQVTQTQVFNPNSQPVEVAPEPVLVAIAGADPHEFKFTEEIKEVFVGRHPDCQVKASDKHVSTKHLRIYRDEKQRFFLEELGISCFINNQMVKKHEHRALRHGDAIIIAEKPSAEKPFASLIFRAPAQRTVLAQKSSECTGTSPARAEGGSEAVENLKQGVTEEWVKKHWDISYELGSGNFSEVRLGIEVEQGKRYAMKMVDKKRFLQFQAKRESVLNLNDEADLMMGLAHPNIVKCHTWFQTEVHLYIALELVEGGDLLHCLLDSGCFEEKQAARLFGQICDAVRYLHVEKQLVHRDLKPENVLLTNKDRETMIPKLADFGLARKNMASRDCRTFCGTPHYFAPEVITTFSSAGAKDTGYGKQVDMWSLGVILYILLSGIPPFEEDNLYRQILDGKYEFDVQEWTRVTEEAKRLVKAMMMVNPRERIDIRQALDHPWLKFPRLCTPARSHAEPGYSGREPVEEPAAKRRKSDVIMA